MAVSVTSEYPQDGDSVCCCYYYPIFWRMSHETRVPTRWWPREKGWRPLLGIKVLCWSPTHLVLIAFESSTFRPWSDQFIISLATMLLPGLFLFLFCFVLFFFWGDWGPPASKILPIPQPTAVPAFYQSVSPTEFFPRKFQKFYLIFLSITF